MKDQTIPNQFNNSEFKEGLEWLVFDSKISKYKCPGCGDIYKYPLPLSRFRDMHENCKKKGKTMNQKWEYVAHRTIVGSEDAMKLLGALGQNGWEAFAVAMDADNFTWVYMKRTVR
jgi:hypothetical protein